MTLHELDTPTDGDMGMLSLLHGIKMTVLSADTACACYHTVCDINTVWLHLKHLLCHSNSQGNAMPS